LKAAKDLCEAEGVAWDRFLADHCDIEWRRYVAVAEGRKTFEDIREAKRQSVAESRQRKAALQKQHVVPEPEPEVHPVHTSLKTHATLHHRSR
jgi:hypothetical protein